MNPNLSKIFINALLLFVFFFGMNLTKIAAQTEIAVKGNVLGYELYKVKSTTIPMLHPVLLKVTEVVDGKEESEFIKILTLGFTEKFAQENFGIDKISTFKLTRKTFCDSKVKRLMYAGLTLDNNGQVIKTSQTFTLVSGVEKTLLPLKKKVPCYVTEEVSQLINHIS